MKLEYNKFFATYKTQKELQEYFNSHTGPRETFLLTLGAGLMWNTIAHILEEENQSETFAREKLGSSQMTLGEPKDQD
tara:strand:+ start:965 stop:1198 length:234 start_codon:yes stop_codon:yes gene_type:complete